MIACVYSAQIYLVTKMSLSYVDYITHVMD